MIKQNSAMSSEISANMVEYIRVYKEVYGVEVKKNKLLRDLSDIEETLSKDELRFIDAGGADDFLG